MRKLTERQKKIVEGILESGRVELSKGSGPDYLAAADFVFTHNLLTPAGRAKLAEERG
jgi:hypothetical protein